MKAGIYLSEKNIAVRHIDQPICGQGEALIKVSYAGICGTDMMIYFGKHPRAQAPLTMGHEFCGVITEIKGEADFAMGDRVVIEPTLSCGKCEACKQGQSHVCKNLRLVGIDTNGGFAEYVKVPFDRLHRIPDQLSDAAAALAEPVAVEVHTVRKSNINVGDNVAILGSGPIGLLVGLVAKLAGASHIFISDISTYRIEKARELGLTAFYAKEVNIVDEVKKRTDGVGADVVFEVAGTQMTTNQTFDLIKIQGQIVVVSVFKHQPTMDLAKMHFKENSLITTRCYSHNDFQTAIHLMASGVIDVEKLISHELPLDHIQEAFSLMEHPDQSLKILIRP